MHRSIVDEGQAAPVVNALKARLCPSVPVIWECTPIRLEAASAAHIVLNRLLLLLLGKPLGQATSMYAIHARVWLLLAYPKNEFKADANAVPHSPLLAAARPQIEALQRSIGAPVLRIPLDQLIETIYTSCLSWCAACHQKSGASCRRALSAPQGPPSPTSPPSSRPRPTCSTQRTTQMATLSCPWPRTCSALTWCM